MDHRQGRARIAHYFPSFTARQLDLLEGYANLLIETNQRINLISRKNEDQVWIDHILHSLSIAKVLEVEQPLRILDFGTGGGLPGIPLAIASPDCEFLLVDSIGKKVKAVGEMAQTLQLNNVQTRHQRVEELTEQFDFAVSRAVTALPRIQQWLQGKLVKGTKANLPNGLIYIKGDELSAIKRPFEIWELASIFKEDFFETKKVVWIDLTL